MSEIRATTRSTERSQALFAKAQEHLAGGVGSGTRSPRSGWRPAPVYVDHASGSRVTDVDGNEYVDYQMGQGPLILGHRPPHVLAAVTRAINERGSHLALCHELEGQAAAAVAARVPSIELLRFGNSGTECVQYALRFARAFTGREKVVRFEGHYHGWSDAIHWSGHPGPSEWGSAAAPTPAPGSSGMPAAVAHDRLGDDRSDPVAVLGEGAIDGRGVVPGQDQQRVGDDPGHAGRAGDGVRVVDRARARKIGMCREVDGVRPAVVVALEAHDQRASGRRACEAQRVLHALGSRVAEAQELDRRHACRDRVRGLPLELVAEGEVAAALVDRLRHGGQ